MLAKRFGSLMLLVGTAIGAGMLALPMVSAQAGLLYSIALLIVIWLLMTITALLVLEVNLAFPSKQNSFHSMALGTLGRPGQWIAWLSCLLLLYALTSAYIAGNGSLLTEAYSNATGNSVANWVPAVLFTLIFGGAVFWSTRAVDLFNRGLITVKGIMLILMLAMLMPHVNYIGLMDQPGHGKYLWAAAPIFITAFGFHTTIPSLSNYLGKDPKVLRSIIIWGATLPLLLYIVWLICALGIIPLTGEQSFAKLTQNNGSVGEFVDILTSIMHNPWVSVGVNGFSDIAMTTSFLGVTLGLFDFLADGFKRHDTRVGRFQTAVLTFIPPLFFALYYPKGFITALGYAGLCVTILEVILPALMAYRLRRSKTLSSPYRLMGGNLVLLIVLLAGVGLIIMQLG